MSTQVKFRRGTTLEHGSFTGAVAEITIDTDKKTAVVHDGATAGGVPLVNTDDSRLSDSRTPTSHSHLIADLPVAADGVSSATDLVRADDSRLSVDADLTAIAALTGTGVAERTGVDIWALRTIGTGANNLVALDANADLVGQTIKDYGEGINAHGSVSATPVSFSFNDGNIHTITLTSSGAMTWDFANPPPSGTAGSMTIIATNAGLRTLTVTNGTWIPEAPTLPESGVSLINAITTDGGANYYLTVVTQ